MPDVKKEQERDELHRAIWAIADELRGSAGVFRADRDWARCADEVTWQEGCKASAPPRYRSRTVGHDFEDLPLGVFRPKKSDMYGHLNVHADNHSAFVVETFGTNRVLRVVDAAGEKMPWTPHLYEEFSYFDCIVAVRFRLRLGKGARIGCAVRDYSESLHKPGAFATGLNISNYLCKL